MAKKKAKKGKEINLIITWLVGLFVLYLILAAVFGKLGTLTYEELVFTKERMGDIKIYHYSYYYNSQNGGVNQYNMYLRIDPRKNNVIVDGAVELGSKTKLVYISVNATEFTKCDNSSIALASLSSFLTNNEYMVKGGSPDKEEAETNDVRYATCENLPSQKVILFEEGEETKIVRENNCYIVTVAGCEILQASEKFQVQAIVDAKKQE